ncbi:DUF1415 family protein [Sandaracinus amylolyticus]|uniref:DUF1415 domain-containing protein n=1 Tax=Sandaracinus amylolyticus TaxID=927083 RepID=A0A0F6YGG3_9BACT|nr:DUF1415 family protein [Sandaracinus amylolyticus]AKF04688.1 hypothetical protein DB32_001837 [Sandaracinus amylolyticus]
MSANDDALVRECLRVYRRYAVEIVETLDFCPYAARCREEGRTREVVVLARELDLERALAEVAPLAADTHVEVALMIWPRVRCTRLDLARFVERLRSAHQAAPGGLVMAMEGFHPDADADVRAPERLVPFVRRTPDPTIQLVRHAVLDRVRRATPSGTAFFDPSRMSFEELLRSPAPRPIHERIAEANHATVQRLTIERVRASMDDILRDRDAAYAALGEPPRSTGEPPGV